MYLEKKQKVKKTNLIGMQMLFDEINEGDVFDKITTHLQNLQFV